MIIPDRLPLQTVHLLATSEAELLDLEAAATAADLQGIITTEESADADRVLAINGYALGERAAELALLEGNCDDELWLRRKFVVHKDVATDGLRNGGGILSLVIAGDKRGVPAADAAFKPGLQTLKEAWDAARARRNGGETHHWPERVPEEV